MSKDVFYFNTLEHKYYRRPKWKFGKKFIKNGFNNIIYEICDGEFDNFIRNSSGGLYEVLINLCFKPTAGNIACFIFIFNSDFDI